MINNLIQRAKSTFSPSPSQHEPIPALEPEPIPSPAATSLKSAPEPAPIDQSPRAIALRAAEAAGWKAGDEQPMAEVCPHQPSKMFLLVRVENWGEPVICHVQNAMSWRPEGSPTKCLPPPHNRLKCRFTGTATAEGRLLFESADKCTAGRYRRAR